MSLINKLLPLLLILNSAVFFAQDCDDGPPENDLVEGAIVMELGQLYVQSTCCATEDVSLCINEGDQYGVWYVVNSGDCYDLSFEVTNVSGETISMVAFGPDGDGGIEEILCCPTVEVNCAGQFGWLYQISPNTDYYFQPFATDIDGCGDFSLVVDCVVPGCTEPTTCNFNPEATLDDGSCTFGNTPNDLYDSPLPLGNVLEDPCHTYNFCFSSDSPVWLGQIDSWFSFDAIFETATISVSSDYMDIRIALFDELGNMLLELDETTLGSESFVLTDPILDTYRLGVAADNPGGVIDICFNDVFMFGDLNTDGIINTLDILFMLSQLGCEPFCDGDMNGDGLVNISDLLLLLGAITGP
jgi:hypothetical protein